MLRCLGRWCSYGFTVSGSTSRCLQSAAFVLSQNVVVPSMGDSITEGTVAEIRKKQDEAVDEDEPILTLETDKVSIDVRSPAHGTIQALLVQVDDTVQIGQVIALVDDSSSSPNKITAPQTPAQSTYEALTDAASEISDRSLKGHKARIRFPPRRTHDGHVISAMPAVDQQKYINRSSSSQDTSQSAEAQPSADNQRVQKKSAAVASYIPRRSLSEREMDAIMQGGAD